MQALLQQPLDDLDLPLARHSSTGLPPFQALGVCGAQLGGGFVDDFPCEAERVHSMMMGQIVPSVKDKVSRDSVPFFAQNWLMTDKGSPKAYNAAFLARTIDLRTMAGFSKKEMAEALKVEYETYKRYENRNPMPHHLVPQFALITRSHVHYLMTGEGPKRMPQPRMATA